MDLKIKQRDITDCGAACMASVAANYKLKLPVCADIGSKVTLSRRIGTRFRLIGYGLILEQ